MFRGATHCVWWTTCLFFLQGQEASAWRPDRVSAREVTQGCCKNCSEGFQLGSALVTVMWRCGKELYGTLEMWCALCGATRRVLHIYRPKILTQILDSRVCEDSQSLRWGYLEVEWSVSGQTCSSVQPERCEVGGRDCLELRGVWTSSFSQPGSVSTGFTVSYDHLSAWPAEKVISIIWIWLFVLKLPN